MAIVQMTPPANGNGNSIAFDGRSYSSAPGVAIGVPDFDVAILTANGWTVSAGGSASSLSTTSSYSSGVLSGKIISPAGVSSGVAVSIYYAKSNVLAGSTVSDSLGNWALPIVPPLDGSGFNVVVRGVFAPSPIIATPISLPTALGNPWAIYSVVRPSGYTGPCIRVQRASDNAQLDVGYTANNIVDKATADAFAAGSQLKVVTYYDVNPGSAEPHNLTTTSFANAPEFIAIDEYLGIRPVALASLAGTTPQEWLERTLTSDGQQVAMNNFTVYQVCAPTTTGNANTLFEFGNAARTTPVAYFNYIGPGAVANPIAANVGGTNNLFPGAIMRSQLNTIGCSSSTAGQIFRSNGNNATNAFVATAINAAKLTFGISAFGAQYNATMDMFVAVIYATGHTSAQMQTVEASLNASIPPLGPGFKNRLVLAGTSLQRAIHCPNKQTECTLAGLSGDPTCGLLASWEVYNMGYPSQTMALTYGTAASPSAILTYELTLSNAAYQNNVYVFCDPINDILAGTYTSTATAQAAMTTLWNTNLLPALQAFQTIPTWNVLVIPTVCACGSLQLGTGNFREDARRFWNGMVRNNAVSLGYKVLDRANNPIMNSTTVAAPGAPNFFADGLHWLLPTTMIEGQKLAALLSGLPAV